MRACHRLSPDRSHLPDRHLGPTVGELANLVRSFEAAMLGVLSHFAPYTARERDLVNYPYLLVGPMHWPRRAQSPSRHVSRFGWSWSTGGGSLA